LLKDSDGTILGQKASDGEVRQYPNRAEIQKSNMLAGNELVWLGDAFEVYIVHVQGSAKIRMPDGRSKQSAMPLITAGNIRVSERN